MNNVSIDGVSTQLVNFQQEVNLAAKNNIIEYSEDRIIKIKQIIYDFISIPNSASKKYAGEYILIDLKTLKSICKNQEIAFERLNNIIHHVNALIYVHFRDTNFNDSDEKYFELAGLWVNLFRNTKCIAAYKHLGVACHNIFIEESPIVFECLPQLSLAHLFFVSFLEPENAKGWIEKLPQVAINVLEDRLMQLQHKTFESTVLERETIRKNIIPQLNQLFSIFSSIIDTMSTKNEEAPSEEIQILFYRKIVQDALSEAEEAQLVPYAQLLVTIKSISQIISSYNRPAFNSIMKLALSTDENLKSLK